MAEYEKENEFEQIKQNIAKEEDQQIDRLKGITRLLDDTEKSGTKTNEELYHQGEQLKTLQGQVKKVDKDLDEAEEDVIKLRSNCCTYWFKKRFTKKKKQKAKYDTKKDNGNNKQINVEYNKNSNSTSAKTASPDKTNPNYLKRQDEYDEHLDDIDGYLARIKGIAIEQGREIDKQNDFLDPFVDDVKNLDERVVGLDKDLQKELAS